MAKGITEATVEELKARTDLVELIESYGVAVKTVGASRKACCPFHHEKTPSFHINESRGFYHCFGCGESGDAIKFVMKMEGLTFVEAVKKLADQCGLKIEEKEDPEAGRRKRLYALMLELAQFYRRCLLKTREAERARGYLEQRDLGGSVQDDWLIGYAPMGAAPILKWGEKYKYAPEELAAAGVVLLPERPGDAGYHRFGGRLMFTIRDKQGRVVGFSGRQLVEDKHSGKYVNSPETAIFKKSRVLFGFDRAAAAIAKSPRHEVIVCEGQIDCIRLHLAGFTNAVAGQGTAFTEEHVKMLKRVTDAAVLVYDDDNAGHKATVKSARLLLAAEIPVRTVSLPNGDDPDSFLRTHSREEFQRLVDGAESIMAFQVRAERAKEANPSSIDAVNRIVRAVLETIAQTPNAVLRAGMVGEAAKLLDLPSAALQEELAKVRVERPRAPSAVPAPAEPIDSPEVDPADWEGEGAFVPPAEPEERETGVAAADVLPPPPRELALCELLMANEYSDEAKTLDGWIGEFLPRQVFAHDFTRAFVETWRAEVAKGEDLMAPWGDSLVGAPRLWFDAILLGQEKYHESAEMPTADLEELVRALWRDLLVRWRGALPAVSGDRQTLARRMRWSELIKRMPTLKWSSVKDIIRELLQGEMQNGS